MTQKEKGIAELFDAYYKAESALEKKRDQLFPVGTKVRSKVIPWLETTVTKGNISPCQVNTEICQMSWFYLETKP